MLDVICSFYREDTSENGSENQYHRFNMGLMPRINKNKLDAGTQIKFHEIRFHFLTENNEVV